MPAGEGIPATQMARGTGPKVSGSSDLALAGRGGYWLSCRCGAGSSRQGTMTRLAQFQGTQKTPDYAISTDMMISGSYYLT
jgi:hypothetical protein